MVAASATVAAETRPRRSIQCHAAEPQSAGLATWSPNGRSVAFAIPALADPSDLSSGTAVIARTDPGAARFTGLAVNWESPPTRLLWAPVGDTLAWQERTGAISVATQGRFHEEREIVHAQFGTVTELGDWSPDARRLVFTRDAHVYTVDVFTGEIRHIADGLH